MRFTPILLLAPALMAAATTNVVNVPTPDRFPANAHVTIDPAVDRWWTTLRDPELTSLVQRALANNLDVKTAAARILQVKAERRVTRAALLPSIDNDEFFGRIRGRYENGNVHIGQGAPGSLFVAPFESNLFQIGFDASWEIDLFGAHRHELEAATADVRSAEESRRDVLVSVLAEVARAYVELRGNQRREAIARENIALEQDSLHLASVRAEAGLATDLDVERQTAQLRSTESQIPAFEASVTAGIHELSVLIGEQPEALTSELRTPEPVPADPGTVATGIPAQLLTRRPDIRRARMQVIASAARVGAAKADLFPKIVLTGAAGRQTTDLSGFSFGAGNFFSFGPSITLPIFEGGRLRANLAARRQELEQASIGYQSAVLQALRETEDGVERYTREQQRYEKLTAAVHASEQATQLANELYRRGLATFLNVLDAQREQLQAQDQLVQSQAQVDTNLIALYKSLGGGWQ